MKTKRNIFSKIIAVFAFIAGVVGLAIGYGEFKESISVASSIMVEPISSIFDVNLVNNNEVYKEGINSEQIDVSNLIINNDDNPIISNININFTNANQSVTYVLYANNTSSRNAYLKSINFDNLDNNISVKLIINGIEYDKSTTLINNQELLNNSYNKIEIIITNNNLEDIPVNVSLNNIELVYSSAN